MPIQERKYFIHKHNMETNRENENMKEQRGEDGGDRVLSGESINAYAALEQQKNRG